MTILIEVFKKVNFCPKTDFNDFIKILESSTKVLSSFCGQKDNRTYMLITNRSANLIDLLLWCFNRPVKFIYSLNFVPNIFHIMISMIKHRIPLEHEEFNEGLFELIFCSGLILKIK